MTDRAIQRLAGLVREATGNVLPAERHAALAELRLRRAQATGHRDLDAYLEAPGCGSHRRGSGGG